MLIRLGKGGKAATLDATAAPPVATVEKPRTSLADLRARFGRSCGGEPPPSQEVTAGVHVTVIEDEFADIVPGVRLYCDRCQHTVEVGGRTGGSVRRALAQLRETCPMGERNWYQAIPEEEAEDDPEELAPAPRGGSSRYPTSPPARGGYKRPASSGTPVGKIRIGGHGRR